MKLVEFNQLSETAAEVLFLQCCCASTWSGKMLRTRPFEDLQSLTDAADHAWRELAENDYLQAFEGHPKIGDINSLREKYQHTKVLASGEQGSVYAASELIINELANYNDQYYKKFGFIFIVCATGKSASQMLERLKNRIVNDRQTELNNACEEQRKIFQIRLNKLFQD